MHDPKIWNLLSRHLAENESNEDNEMFLIWFNKSTQNKAYFYKVKGVWDNAETINEESFKHKATLAFREKFSFPRIKNFIVQQSLGNLVGFIVGMWVSTTFTHHILERRSIHNLFGILRRKKVLVNDIPHWLQTTISILIGFLVLELINYFFQNKLYLLVWKYIKRTIKI